MLKERAPKVFMAELVKSIGKSRDRELARDKNYFISNAEGLLHLRCQLKSGNWDSFYKSTVDKLANLE